MVKKQDCAQSLEENSKKTHNNEKIYIYKSTLAFKGHHKETASAKFQPFRSYLALTALNLFLTLDPSIPLNGIYQ